MAGVGLSRAALSGPTPSAIERGGKVAKGGTTTNARESARVSQIPSHSTAVCATQLFEACLARPIKPISA